MRIRLVLLGIAVCLGTTVAPCQEKDPERRQPSEAAFRSLFSIANVQFTEQQLAKISELRKEYVPKLIDVNEKRNTLLTPETRRAMQEALRAARDAGKNNQEAREAANKAAGLSDDQRQQLATLQKQQAETVAAIQAKIRGLLTEQQQATLRRANRNPGSRGVAQRVITPTHADVKYGPHRRNVLDVWLAESSKPTPVLVSIHGGGFRGGNKGIDQGLLRECLDSKISVVAITYRLSDQAIAPAQFLDSARAVQFIRDHAKQWNIDPQRLAATGGSAGAGISLWLGFHDDLADPKHDDPVLRQSTRLSCMAVYNGQTTYDPRVIRELFDGTDTYRHPALSQLFDIDFGQLDKLPNEKYELFREVSALPHVSKDDVPTLLMYASNMDTEITNQSIGIHHPRFGKVLMDKMDTLGIQCTVETGVQRGNSQYVQMVSRFIKQHFGLPQNQ